MLEFEASQVMQELEAIRARMVANRPQLLRAWGRNLLDRTHRDFAIKSRGGTGSDGIKWAPLKPATIRRKRGAAIGIRSGELEQPVGDLLRVTGNQVEAGYADPHAEFFDERRPLMPIPIPDSWHQHLEKMAEDWAMQQFANLS